MEPTRAPRFRLITLGRIALVTPDGEHADLGRRKRKLALLAVLALSPEPVRRETLALMFWGDEDPDRARHSLSDALSHLRRVLGRSAIVTRDGLVELGVGDDLSVDAVELARALANDDFATVRTLYKGPFLDRLKVEHSVAFDTWVATQRANYQAAFDIAQNPPELPAAVQETSTGTHQRKILSAVAAMVVVTTVVGFLTATFVRSSSARTAGNTPLVALTNVFTDPADTSLAWLSEGFEQMVAADLGRVSSAGIVAPSLTRGTMFDSHYRDSLSDAESIERARRLHADWASSAVIRRQRDTYLVTITLRNVRTRKASHYSISGADILTVVDGAAATMLAALDITGTGPRLSDVETANTDAYRLFVESQEAALESDPVTERRDLDAAIAADSDFTSAIVARLQLSDSATYERLKPLLARARTRMTPWDRAGTEIFEAGHAAQPTRAESLARERAFHFPRDPRSWQSLGDLYIRHASYAAAESAFARLLALDAASPVDASPCWTCSAYAGLMAARHGRGDFAGEIAYARKFTEFRPADHSAWLELANVLDLNGDVPAAQSAYARHLQLVPGSGGFDPYVGRMMLLGRRYDEAEEYARRYVTSAGSGEARDLLESVLRERGQFVAALKEFDTERARTGHPGLELVYANTLAETGRVSEAQAAMERITWHPRNASTTQYGFIARGFAWHHALIADAIRTRADTLLLRSLADSIQHVAAWSDYARDWTLHHHVLGLVAERAGRLNEARAEFEAALSLVRGWTRTNIELAKVDLALGAPDRAIETLRGAYREPLDAMGRYAPRSELDFQMALAFARAKQADSAHIYASYVRSAWVHADPETSRRLNEIAAIQ